jgi:hypothetical protein
VKLEPGGKPWRLTLDSGASHLVVECDQACPPVHEVQHDKRLITFLGERPVVYGKLRNVEIGGSAMPQVEAVVVDTQSADWGDQGVLPAKWFSAVYVKDKLVRFAFAH